MQLRNANEHERLKQNQALVVKHVLRWKKRKRVVPDQEQEQEQEVVAVAVEAQQVHQAEPVEHQVEQVDNRIAQTTSSRQSVVTMPTVRDYTTSQKIAQPSHPIL